MVFRFLLLICFLLYFSSSSAQDTSVSHSSYKKMYKLKESAFRQQYRTDAKSGEVIKLFYHKRRSGFWKMATIPAPILLGVAGYTLDRQQNGDVISPIFSATGIVTGLMISIPLSTSGVVQTCRYNRKRLLGILQDYNQTGELPQWVEKKL